MILCENLKALRIVCQEPGDIDALLSTWGSVERSDPLRRCESDSGMISSGKLLLAECSIGIPVIAMSNIFGEICLVRGSFALISY